MVKNYKTAYGLHFLDKKLERNFQVIVWVNSKYLQFVIFLKKFVEKYNKTILILRKYVVSFILSIREINHYPFKTSRIHFKGTTHNITLIRIWIPYTKERYAESVFKFVGQVKRVHKNSLGHAASSKRASNRRSSYDRPFVSGARNPSSVVGAHVYSRYKTQHTLACTRASTRLPARNKRR